jgi:hypothetical protein
MERIVLREIVQVINEVINYSPPNPRLQATLTREFFTSEAPASPASRGRTRGQERGQALAKAQRENTNCVSIFLLKW